MAPTSMLCTSGKKPGVYRGEGPAVTKQRKHMQLNFYGNRVDDEPLTPAAQRLRELENLLSHDQWDFVEGRDVLWREVADILRTNPLLRTTLVVPADEQQKDYNRVHPNPVVVATIEEDDAMLLHFLQANRHANVNVKAGQWAYTPLHCATTCNNVELVELLLSRRADVDARDGDGDSPLHLAADVRIFRLLLAAGASVDTTNKNGRTPLHNETEYADSDGDHGILRLLLEADADVNASHTDPYSRHGLPIQPLLRFDNPYWDPSNQERMRTGLERVQLLCAHGAYRDPFYFELGEYMASPATREWLRATADWISPLHHFDLLSLAYLRKMLRSSVFWTQEHPTMPSVDLHARAGPASPSPLQLACSQPVATRSAGATLVVRAAQPWSPHSHELFPLEARRLAEALMPIGYHLEFHRHYRGLGALWTAHVLPELITRESRRVLRVADVLSMRGPELMRELLLRKLEPSEEKAVMVGRLLQAIGAFEVDEQDAVEW